jgi:hypothetical protein
MDGAWDRTDVHSFCISSLPLVKRRERKKKKERNEEPIATPESDATLAASRLET